MDSIWNINLREFLHRVSSREPTPGGGAVAAVAAAQGLALVLMALEVNLHRKEPHPEAAGILAKGKDLMKPLCDSADHDMEVFNTYMKAMLLPKGTPEKDEARSRAMSRAAVGALEAPLRSAEICLEALTVAREAIGVVHRGIVSDVGAGAALIHGAITATLYNVDVNLRGIEAPGHQSEASASRKEIQRRADELAYVIQKETAASI